MQEPPLYLVLSEGDLKRLGMTLEDAQAVNRGVKVVLLRPIPTFLAPDRTTRNWPR